MSEQPASIRQAGEILGQKIRVEPDGSIPPYVLGAFEIANRWRSAHEGPMRGLRASAIHCLRHQETDGVTGARLKRLAAIRRKLARDRHGKVPFTLDEIQDIAGCRVIVGTIDDARGLAERMRRNVNHRYERENDYIADPKRSGYRSLHLIFETGARGASGETKHIELQVRTRLQHSWATAVEAVGTYLRQNLKGSEGVK